MIHFSILFFWILKKLKRICLKNHKKKYQVTKERIIHSTYETPHNLKMLPIITSYLYFKAIGFCTRAINEMYHAPVSHKVSHQPHEHILLGSFFLFYILIIFSFICSRKR